MAFYSPAQNTPLGGIGFGTQATTAGTINQPIWATWNQQYYALSSGAITTIANTTVWASWNAGYQQPGVLTGASGTGQAVPYVPTAEEKAKLKEAEEARKRAEQRAQELLLEHLEPNQRESYKKTGLFIVETPKKNRYALARSAPPRKLNDKDKPIVSYCIHTFGLPKEDELLGFKLMLEANEDEFLKTANATALAA